MDFFSIILQLRHLFQLMCLMPFLKVIYGTDAALCGCFHSVCGLNGIIFIPVLMYFPMNHAACHKPSLRHPTIRHSSRNGFPALYFIFKIKSVRGLSSFLII